MDSLAEIDSLDKPPQAAGHAEKAGDEAVPVMLFILRLQQQWPCPASSQHMPHKTCIDEADPFNDSSTCSLVPPVLQMACCFVCQSCACITTAESRHCPAICLAYAGYIEHPCNHGSLHGKRHLALLEWGLAARCLIERTGVWRKCTWHIGMTLLVGVTKSDLPCEAWDMSVAHKAPDRVSADSSRSTAELS